MRLPPHLARPFALLAFDWDGTAVASRRDDATAIRLPLERLLRSGVVVAVITGTSFGNLDAQLCRAMKGRHKRGLFLCTNRGSEVFSFDDASQPVLLWRRVATAREEELLSAIAEEVRDTLVRRIGLPVQLVYDRLNRRKIDLIPEERWRDPPKSALGELLSAVETRLRGGGLSGGLHEAFALTQEVARRHGLIEARITSDVKHLEVGLTDKGDALAWVLRELARPRGVATRDILVGGDEFGPIAGYPGSDARMLLAEARDAAFVSVGPEPSGVPEGVLHLGGGPPAFVELVEQQAELHTIELPLTPTADPSWVLVEEGFTPTREHEVESAFALGNGYLGCRASLAEGSPLSAPATFIAGAFDGVAGKGPTLARLTGDWSYVSGRVGDEPMRLDTGETLSHRRVLDLRQGVLWREWRRRDRSGRITNLRGLRLASLADPHLLVQSVELTPENFSGELRVWDAPSVPTSAQTTSGVRIAAAMVTGIEEPRGRLPRREADGAWVVDLELGKSYRFDRLVAVHTTRDGARPEAAALATVQAAHEQGFAAAARAHRQAWQERWQAADVRLDGDAEAQRALRFAVYHLISAAATMDERASVGARGLTGPAYEGHVFWDTEIYILPFFTLTFPERARALLMYRYHTLPAARAKATRLGYRGALYAWESADTGEEVTPAFFVAPGGEIVAVRSGEQEHHISAAVAYAVFSYWHTTRDDRFMLEAGAEILVETARFWASRVTHGADGRAHITAVMGPDEYHESVDDDAYTNGMARWNLEAAHDLARLMAATHPRSWQALAERLSLRDAEVASWPRLAEAIYLGLDERTGVIEQFRGYFELEDLRAVPFEERNAPMDLLLGRERTRRSQVIKQPDVLMLIWLLWDRFPAHVREACFRYYEPRTGHGSSLSPPVHALLAARLGHDDLAYRYFRQTADIDLANNMGNAAGGVHLAALGGLWQAAVFGFAGVELRSEPRIAPRLPAAWRRLSCKLRWRGRELAVDVPGRPGEAVEASA